MDWKIRKTAGQCCKCRREFAPGEEFYSALYDSGSEFERRDFCGDCWEKTAGTAPEGDGRPFSFWRAAVEETPKKRSIDLELVKEVFDRLERDDDPMRLKIRYFLSLILMRKRALRYVRTEQEGRAEYMVVRVPRAQVEYKIRNPDLTQGELEDVKAELENLLDMELGSGDTPATSENGSEPS